MIIVPWTRSGIVADMHLKNWWACEVAARLAWLARAAQRLQSLPASLVSPGSTRLARHPIDSLRPGRRPASFERLCLHRPGCGSPQVHPAAASRRLHSGTPLLVKSLGFRFQGLGLMRSALPRLLQDAGIARHSHCVTVGAAIQHPFASPRE